MRTDFFEYIKWRGDLDFKSSPLNSVDALIFSQLAYLNFDGIVSSSFSKSISIKNAAAKFTGFEEARRKDLGVAINSKTVELLYACAESNRFGSVELTGFSDIFNAEKEEQFCALTFFCRNMCFVAFRGTDDSFVGWKEDFNLGYKDVVPSQKDALRYLEKALKAELSAKICCGGHSKGGNLAIYAAANLDSSLSRKLSAVYNFDGPGFKKEVITSKPFKSVLKKTHTYYPQFSIVGMLFCHDPEFKVVKAHDFLAKQHDPFNWDVDANELLLAEKLEKGSEVLCRAFDEWFTKLSPEQLELFVGSIFQILGASEAQSNSEFSESRLKSSARMIKAFANMDETTRKAVMDIVGQFLSSAKNQINSKKIEKK